MRELINPRQTILVSSRAGINHFGKEILKDNIAAVDWHTPLSFSPLLYCILLSKKRFSYELIFKSKVFGINFMPYDLHKEVLFCGRNSGNLIDKFEKCGLDKTEAKKIDCCLVKEACAHLECEVYDEIVTGDHVMFLGRVLFSSLNSNNKRIFHTKGEEFTTTRD